MKKKVLFLHPCGVKSGACNSLIAIIENLDKSKFDPIVLCPKGTAYDALSNVTKQIFDIATPPELITISGYPRNNLRILYFFALIPRLIKIIKLINKLNPEIIHLNELSLGPMAVFLKKRNFKVVVHARIVLDSNKKVINKLIIYLLNKYCDHIFCIDGSVRSQLIKINHASIVYNSYLFNSIDLKYTIKKKEEFSVLYLANLITHKGIFDLLDSAIQLSNFEKINFLICGVNSRNDKFYLTLKGKILSKLNIVPNNSRKIAVFIERNKLQNVQMLGHVSNIKDIILNSSVLLFPSYMNGPPRSVFEAGVFGVPSIISLRDKVEDVVENNINGLIIDEHSPQQITEAILKMYNNKELCEQLGKNASIKFKKLNNPVFNVRKVETVYLSLLNHD
jgi:glycosyltransferase involved in cell wall biosynthesis